jgi:cephalosporin hydroxylase
MLVSAWNNGDYSKTGAGYGLRISKKDKIKYFKQSWEKVIVIFDGQEVHTRAVKTLHLFQDLQTTGHHLPAFFSHLQWHFHHHFLAVAFIEIARATFVSLVTFIIQS